ncbi:hypothetical protein DSS3P1_10 [Ruegeria phage DSS3-P1]|uniref:hypothetical protein n=1 Tax=Ruegeria phage DSS3-P1 TaxID=1555208 RepID=UPI0002357D8B|nr:hypothetical protein DSS3P1_10 [Ruegeria phage DSS3-P1]YP_009997226.1 hypothetical protein JT312_gp09 [Ruegeria phage vB_RpoS-V18]YP_009997308.1 hypothetical protein JT313_gp09 [Ruegeria phage vB_RpoS-V11]YP_009997391.1 hypothetical protein JT314_gp10 [Ruegeria phage vB_RpoS-V7]AET42327.1 hypothetical protein SDSG_00062 [Ruegeria phage DSS3-P1]AIT13245.1 hypothetical protein DSS3P1_10 [Ruegeria phage DSS3-P1]AWY08713.1 hypothetical protein vBRpoSV7_10 [Ruegeria phage vB_RpoS-V7]AWY08885.1
MTKKAQRHLAAIDAAARLIHREGFARPDPVDLVTGAAMLADAAAELTRQGVRRLNGIPRYNFDTRDTRATWTDADEKRAFKAEERARARVRDAVQIIFGPDAARLTIEMQPDPRGAAVYLHLDGEGTGFPAAAF